MLDEVSVDGFDQVLYTLKTPVNNGLLGQVPEESLYHVQPGSTGWSKMQVKARMACQPSYDFKDACGVE